MLDTGVRSDTGVGPCGVVSSWELAAVAPAACMRLSTREGFLRDPHLMEGFFPWIGRFPSFAARAAGLQRHTEPERPDTVATPQ